MANSYGVGDLVRATGTWTDADGAAADPDALTFKVRPPSGTTVTKTYGVDAEVVKSSTGIYYYDIDITEAGTYWYQFQSTGAGQAR